MIHSGEKKLQIFRNTPQINSPMIKLKLRTQKWYQLLETLSTTEEEGRGVGINSVSYDVFLPIITSLIHALTNQPHISISTHNHINM